MVVQRMVGYFAHHKMLTIVVIFSLSFLIRFSILMRVPRDQILGTGEASNIAKALVSKGQFADPYVIPTGPTAHTTPLFPLLLAGIYRVFGMGYAGNFVRCLLVISSYSMLYALYPAFASAFGFPVSAGLIAGFASALLPVKRSAEVFRGWEEPYAAILLAFLLLITLRRAASPEKTPKSAAWMGLCWGLALYVSFSLSTVLIGLLLLDLLTDRSRRALRDVVITSVVVFAVISPWLLRNHNQLHGWTLMRDNLGLELRYSNHDRAGASSTLLNADPVSWSMHPTNNAHEAMRVRELGEIAYNRQELHEALAWISTHPVPFFRLSLQRFIYFWFGPREHPYELIVTSCYTLLGLVGLGFIRKRVGAVQFQLWCTVWLLYPVLYYFVQYINRYRVPIDWMIWLSAGLVLSRWLEPRLDRPRLAEPQQV